MIADVIATFGRHLLLRDAAGILQKARPFGRTLDIVCGDRVECEFQGSELLATATLPRANLLRRSTLRGRSEPLAANVQQLAVVIAPVPVPDLFLVDRYLCTADSLGLQALVVLNKTDMAKSDAVRESLAPYAGLGFEIVCASTLHHETTDRLTEALRDRVTVLAGQSGVGKSSLTRLVTSEDSHIAVGELMRDEEGRHTTTASRMYMCRQGGFLIDTPGVRDFAPAIDDLEPATLGFREVARLAPGCRYQDCRHMQEPACAVRSAVQAGTMDARRYESYRRLRRLFDQLWEKRSESERAARRR